jgi:hypothetical protein
VALASCRRVVTYYGPSRERTRARIKRKWERVCRGEEPGPDSDDEGGVVAGGEEDEEGEGEVNSEDNVRGRERRPTSGAGEGRERELRGPPSPCLACCPPRLAVALAGTWPHRALPHLPMNPTPMA